jgi:hypothetical protein
MPLHYVPTNPNGWFAVIFMRATPPKEANNAVNTYSSTVTSKKGKFPTYNCRDGGFFVFLDDGCGKE